MSHYKKVFLSIFLSFMVSVSFAANPVSQTQLNQTLATYQASMANTVNNAVNIALNSTPKIGDICGGGFIYYVDNQKRKGLIVAPTDVSGDTVSWTLSDITDNNMNLNTSLSLFSGMDNTSKMLSSNNSPAAISANSYISSLPSNNCQVPSLAYSDWHLPSQNELMLLWAFTYQNDIKNFNPLLQVPYWSSSEEVDGDPVNNAWSVQFSHGYTSASSKSGTSLIRSIRYFYY